MNKKIINLIIGLVSIIIGLLIFNTAYNDYSEQKEFYDNALNVDGTVNSVKKENNKYSFEYRYTINGQDYKKYVSNIKLNKELKDGDSINVYYDKDNVEINTIDDMNMILLYVGITLFIITTILGFSNILKYFKK